MNDPIADLLIRIKNAALAGRKTVVAPYSKQKESLANVLAKEKLLEKVETSSDKRELTLTLIEKNGKVRLVEVKRISKPGRRVYTKAKGIKVLGRGLGTVIISSPVGLITNREAMKKNLGGEVVCKIV